MKLVPATALGRCLSFLLGAGIAGCGPSAAPGGDSAASQASDGAMPTVTRVVFSPDSASAPFSKVPIAADPRGGVFFYGETAGRQLLTRLDSTGMATDRFGVSGPGPGEISGAGVLLTTGDTLAIYDTHKAAVVLFGPDGEVRGEFRLAALAFPLALDGDRLYTMDQDAPLKHEAPSIVAHSFGSGTDEIVLGAGDHDFIEAVIPDPSRPAGHLPIPVFAAHGNRIAIGDPRVGRIVVRDGDTSFALQAPGQAPVRGPRGVEEVRTMLETSLRRSPESGAASSRRAASLRERLDTLERERLPWFSWPGLQFDHHGRLWVFSDRDDSTAVDVFAGDRHLGHLVLGCYHPDKWVSLVDGWLALQCRSDPSADVPYELQLYRVQG